MLTKLVVTVASVTSTAAPAPASTAASIAPGSVPPDSRASAQPSGISHHAVSVSPSHTAHTLVRAVRVKRE